MRQEGPLFSPVQEKPGYFPYLDWVRLIACLLVIVNHTAAQFILTANGGWDGASWVVLTCFYTSKIAIALFLMISGALLFSMPPPTFRSVLRRVLRVFVALFTVSLIVYIGEHRSITGFAAAFLGGHIAGPYWYLYMLLGLYLIYPLLYRMVYAMRRQEFYYFFLLWILFTALYLFFEKLGMPSFSWYFVLSFIQRWLGYFIFGFWFSKQDFALLRKKAAPLLAITLSMLCIAFSVVYTAFQYRTAGSLALLFDDAYMLVNAVPAVTVFYLCKYFLGQRTYSPRGIRVLRELGACTFGVYLFHVVPIGLFRTSFLRIVDIIGRIPAMLLFQLAIFALCLGVSFLLRRIRPLRAFL